MLARRFLSTHWQWVFLYPVEEAHFRETYTVYVSVSGGRSPFPRDIHSFECLGGMGDDIQIIGDLIFADTDIAIDPPGGRFFAGRVKDPVSGGDQGGGDSLTFVGLNRLPIKQKFHRPAAAQISIESIGFQLICQIVLLKFERFQIIMEVIIMCLFSFETQTY